MASAEEGTRGLSAVSQKRDTAQIRAKLVIPGENLNLELQSIEQRVRVGA